MLVKYFLTTQTKKKVFDLFSKSFTNGKNIFYYSKDNFYISTPLNVFFEISQNLEDVLLF